MYLIPRVFCVDIFCLKCTAISRAINRKAQPGVSPPEFLATSPFYHRTIATRVKYTCELHLNRSPYPLLQRAKSGNTITITTGGEGGVTPGGGDAAGLSPVSPFLLRPENREKRAAAKLSSLSVGAAWMLGHLTFGQQAGGARVESFMGGRKAPKSRVSVAGSEATALGLLSCPGIGWAPDPVEVVRTVSGTEDGVFYTAAAAITCNNSSSSDRGEDDCGAAREAGVREACAACDELVAAGLCVRSQDRGWLQLVPEVGWVCSTTVLCDFFRFLQFCFQLPLFVCSLSSP